MMCSFISSKNAIDCRNVDIFDLLATPCFQIPCGDLSKRLAAGPVKNGGERNALNAKMNLKGPSPVIKLDTTRRICPDFCETINFGFPCALFLFLAKNYF